MTTTVYIENPNISAAIVDFNSVTEYVDLPRKFECLEGEEATIADSNDPCQTGCEEPLFQFIVEPGDSIPLQFRFADTANADPLNPTLGWYDGAGYLVRLEILNMAGAVVWSGPASDISAHFSVFTDEYGSVQNILIDVDALLSATEGSVACWFFRVSVALAVPQYEVVNFSDDWAGDPPYTEVGTLVLNQHSGSVGIYERTVSGWTLVSTPADGTIIYVANGAQWLEYTAPSIFTEIPMPDVLPPGEAVPLQAFTTMAFRLRKCDESIVHFTSYEGGVDCAGYVHALGKYPVGLSPRPYQYDFKVKGSFEMEEMPVEREMTKHGRLRRTTLSSKARVRTYGLPEKIARRVQTVLGASTFAVNGQPWDEAESVHRNNDEGRLWYVDVILSRKDCEKEASCD